MKLFYIEMLLVIGFIGYLYWSVIAIKDIAETKKYCRREDIVKHLSLTANVWVVYTITIIFVGIVLYLMNRR